MYCCTAVQEVVDWIYLFAAITMATVRRNGVVKNGYDNSSWANKNIIDSRLGASAPRSAPTCIISQCSLLDKQGSRRLYFTPVGPGYPRGKEGPTCTKTATDKLQSTGPRVQENCCKSTSSTAQHSPPCSCCVYTGVTCQLQRQASRGGVILRAYRRTSNCEQPPRCGA